MLHRFRSAFDDLVEQLTRHPRVRVTHVWCGAPATDEMLDQLSRAIGHPVAEGVRALYRQANGVQLRWLDSGDEGYDPSRDDRRHTDGPWSRLFEAGPYTGYLDLPTLEELASRETVGSMFDGNDVDYLDRAIPFDCFSDSQDAVIFFGDEVDDPWISIASDHLADVDPPGSVTLAGYLEHVVETWASIEHRRQPGPQSLDTLLRQRVELELPAYLAGRRVIYRDDHRGSCLMHGRAVSFADLVSPPRWWWHGPTVIEVLDDLGETVYVPFRALFPPDTADGYERLHADVDALRLVLQGPAERIFEELASVALMTHRAGLVGGTLICNHAWAHAGLTSRLTPAEAVRLLFLAADRLLDHPESRVARAVAWPVTRPSFCYRNEMSMDTLAVGLFDAAVLHIGRAAPRDLAAWLGADATARLNQRLRAIQAANRLVGYDPLTDPATTASFVARALRGGATALEIAARGTRHGGELGLARHRVIGS